ncbi:Ribonuclease H domain [Dillenia turbinata]|uniref:Ribonuclease H domain n=1 Tax=Dillenia turbinata TaxID=194707 RepID=A0AAN8V9K3_9MAGN
MATAWMIWKDRCNLDHKREVKHPQLIVNFALSIARDCYSKIQVKMQNKKRREGKWNCPQDGWIKLNTDGAVNPRMGGLMQGRCGGVREGLKIAKKKSMKNIVIETDFEMLVRALHKGVNVDHPLEIMLQDCKEDMLEVNACSISHIFRESNRCSDRYAKMGQEANPGVHELSNPLLEVLELINIDLKS